MRTAALISLSALRSGASWARQLAGALDKAVEMGFTNGRVYVHWSGGWAHGPFQRQAMSELSIAFDCLPTAAAMCDLVPLLPMAGWTNERIGAIEDIGTVLLPDAAAASDADAAVDDADERALREAREEIIRARRAVGLPELSSVHASLGAAPPSMVRPEAGNPEGPLAFGGVAVGGTFDHMHTGHRLLLSVSALCCTRTLYIGIAGDKLLASKADADRIWPFERRQAAAAAYVKRVRPDVHVEVSALLDPKVPPKAATMEEITALVISRETHAGGLKVLEMRREAGISSNLSLLLVDLVGAASQDAHAHKLSSSELRRGVTASPAMGDAEPS
mmetsp:Transcript_45259/g.94323  ORF Transcript_45259/g.94323 Transcript_45259/m.94323 type:complete len:333 (+) Transcript_45259:197-1195(+)